MERKEAIRSAYRLTGGNKPFWKKLMYRAFSTAQKHCDTEKIAAARSRQRLQISRKSQ